MVKEIEDLEGVFFWLNHYVARAVIQNNSPCIKICKVTKVENGKIYLDGSKQPIRYPDRLLIIGE